MEVVTRAAMKANFSRKERAPQIFDAITARLSKREEKEILPSPNLVGRSDLDICQSHLLKR